MLNAGLSLLSVTRSSLMADCRHRPPRMLGINIGVSVIVAMYVVVADGSNGPDSPALGLPCPLWPH